MLCIYIYIHIYMCDLFYFVFEQHRFQFQLAFSQGVNFDDASLARFAVKPMHEVDSSLPKFLTKAWFILGNSSQMALIQGSEILSNLPR